MNFTLTIKNDLMAYDIDADIFEASEPGVEIIVYFVLELNI